MSSGTRHHRSRWWHWSRSNALALALGRRQRGTGARAFGVLLRARRTTPGITTRGAVHARSSPVKPSALSPMPVERAFACRPPPRPSESARQPLEHAEERL